MDKKKASISGLNFFTVLFLVFLTLKLTNTISWSWWWVTSPLWLPIGVLFVTVVIYLIIQAFKSLINKEES